MQQPRPDEFCAEIRSSAGTLADIVRTQDPHLPIATCPDWSLRELAAHLGRVHRWSAEIIRTRAAQRIPFGAVPDSQYPDESAAQATWLTDGADRLIAALAEAGSAQVWAFGTMAPATFWARRQAHETMVHRIDAELASGRAAELDPGLAADGIDEWLWLLGGPRRPALDASALPADAVLHLRAADDGRPPLDWMVSVTAEGITTRDGRGPADITVAGPAGRLLLVLVRRLPPGSENVLVTGNPELLAGFLASTPF